MADPRDIDYATYTDEQLEELFEAMVGRGYIDPRMGEERGIRRFQRLLPSASRRLIETLFTKLPEPFTTPHLMPIPTHEAVRMLANVIARADGSVKAMRPFRGDLPVGGQQILDQAIRKAEKQSGAEMKRDLFWEAAIAMARQLRERGLSDAEIEEAVGRSITQLAAAAGLEDRYGWGPEDFTRLLQAIEVAKDEEAEEQQQAFFPPQLQEALHYNAMAYLPENPSAVVARYWRNYVPGPPRPDTSREDFIRRVKQLFDQAREQGAYPLDLRHQRENPFSEEARGSIRTLPNGKDVFGNGDEVIWEDRPNMQRRVVGTKVEEVREPVFIEWQKARSVAATKLKDQGLPVDEEQIRRVIGEMQQADPDLAARMYRTREVEVPICEEYQDGTYKYPTRRTTLDSIIRRQKSGPIDPMTLEQLIRDLRVSESGDEPASNPDE
jgi:hypothetical protein